MPKLSTLIILILLIALLGSLAGNAFLFGKAKEFYGREAMVRMTPINYRFAAANKKLLAAPRPEKPRIILFGESRAAMWADHRPTAWGEFEWINRGIGGETTPQILGRLENDVLPHRPDLVILQMGDNDLKTIATLSGTKSKAIESTYRNITTIAQRIADSGSQVLLTTIFPPSEVELLRKPLWSPEVNAAIDTVNQRLLAFEHPGVTVIDCDPFLRDGTHIDPRYAIDTLHLNAAGYAALNEALAPTAQELLANKPR